MAEPFPEAPRSPSPVTEAVAGWATDLDPAALPDDVLDTAKQQVVSILAAAYAGTLMPPGRSVVDAVAGFRDPGTATVLAPGRDLRVAGRNAALANAVLTQVLEWEDWVDWGHVGAGAVPVALAAAEQSVAEGRPVSGRDLLAGIVVGDEIGGRASEVLQDVVQLGNAAPHQPIGLTAVAARLLGLDQQAAMDALGAALTQELGGTIVLSWTGGAKGLLTGWPAMVAMTAAELARTGLVGNRQLLEAGSGYMGKVSNIARMEDAELLAELPRAPGDDWRLRTLVSKNYPLDGFKLAAVDSALAARERVPDELRASDGGPDPDALEEIVLFGNAALGLSTVLFNEPVEGPDGGWAYEGVWSRLGPGGRPDWTYMVLLFDAFHAVSAALRRGRLTHRDYLPETLETAFDADSTIRRLARKIRLKVDLVRFSDPETEFGAEVRLRFADGREVGVPFEQPSAFGGGWELVAGKFHTAAADVLSEARRNEILDAGRRLEEFENVRAFTDLLA